MSKYGELEEKLNSNYYEAEDARLHEIYLMKRASGEKCCCESSYEEFKKDCFEAFEITDNPKAERLWSLCWDRGHSEGYRRVFEWLDEWVDLIQ